MAARYRLKLTKLDFLSAVDAGAQGPIANAVLLKRAGEVEGTFRVAKTDDKLGLVFGWAFASSLDGGATPHTDLQQDEIDADFLKTAVDFMEAGAATDVMHDGAQDGRVVFAFPLLPDVCKALGIATKTVGLAVAIKPSPATFKRFQSGELAAFSIGGMGERTPVGKKATCPSCGQYATAGTQTCAGCGAAMAKRGIFARTLKQAVLTSVTDGHQHSLDASDPASYQWDGLSTSYQTIEGAATGHSHPWTFDATTGAVTIGMDSGHTHTVDVSVNAFVLAAAAQVAANEAAAAAQVALNADAVPTAIPVEESSGATIVVIAARANSTPAMPIGKVDITSPESIQMPKTEAEITALEKRLEHAERIAKLSGAHKTHLDTLTGDDAEDFLAKSSAEREAIVAPLAIELEKRNAVEYVAGDGTIYRKSDDQKLVAMAKREDAAIKREQGEVFKRRAAVEISHFGKTVDVRAEILRAVDGIADEATRKDAHEALRGANVAMLELGKRRGVNPGDVSEGDADPLAKFNAGVEDYRTKKAIKTFDEALEKYLGTPDGRIAKSAYDATRGYSK